MTVPSNLLYALNGLAAQAKTNQDTNALSLVLQIYALADDGLPASSYQTATTTTTNFFSFGTFFPAGSVAPTHDTIFDLGVTNIGAIGG